MTNFTQTIKMKKILEYSKWVIISSILPVILIFVLSIHINNIRKNKSEFNLSSGNIHIIGFTEKIYQGKSYRSFPFPTKTKVLYVKLKNDNNLYSFFSKDTMEYTNLLSQLNENDYVKIYNEGIKKTQNTIDIIQLEKGNKIIINKEIYNKKERGDAIFILIILILYFSFPILFIIKSKYEEKKNHKSKIRKR